MMRCWGPGALAVVGPAGICLLDFFFSCVRFICCWVIVCALSPFYILIYMFWRWCIGGFGVFRSGGASVCLGPRLGWGWGWCALGPV